METQKWLGKYPGFELITSSRDRMRPYSPKEIATLIDMKQKGCTIQHIADQLGRSYWSVVYKTKDLQDQNFM